MEFYHERRQKTTILHFGDHDPSGLDMTRDILDRMTLFNGKYNLEDLVDVKRLALNIDQVKKFNPPPSPAMEVDPRAGDYIAMYGEDSWELDALSPSQLDELVTTEVKKHIEWKEWHRRSEQETLDKSTLADALNLMENPVKDICDPEPEDLMRANQYLYYVESKPALTDREYDMFCRDNALDGKGGSDRASDYSDLEKGLAFLIMHGQRKAI